MNTKYWVWCENCGALQRSPNGVEIHAARQLKAEHDDNDKTHPKATIQRLVRLVKQTA